MNIRRCRKEDENDPMTCSRTPVFLVGLRVLLAFGLLLAGCATQSPATEKPGTLQAVATTTMIADMAKNVAGDRIAVESLLKPGKDPHTYYPVPADVKKVAQADLILINGHHLELWLQELIDNAGGERPVFEVTKGIPGIEVVAGGKKQIDPHMWMSVPLAIRYVENIRDAFIQVDPDGAQIYRANAEKYIRELRELDAWIRAEIAKLPADQRKLVTSHDAFQYFGKEYGFQIIGTYWGVTTDEAPGADKIRRLVDDIRSHGVRAAFIESSVSPKQLEQIARDAGITIGGTLYADSLGPEGSDADTYIGMMRHNVRTIVSALRGTKGE